MQIDESRSGFGSLFLKPEKVEKTFPPGTKKDESFDIIAVNSNAWRSRSYTRATQIQGWTLFFLTGFFTGVIAFGMDKLEENLVAVNIYFTE